jgi:hypothetical protein
VPINPRVPRRQVLAQAAIAQSRQRTRTPDTIAQSILAHGSEPDNRHLQAGHLIAAGRYDGMDFPGDTCRVEILPEVTVATSDLEEFVSAYLRDAPFATTRFDQRVAQALGRCNRFEDDRVGARGTRP